MPSPDYATTPRRALRALKGDSLISDIDAGFLALATDVENDMAGYSSGTRTARGSAALYDGLLWRETDTGVLGLQTGTAASAFRTIGLALTTVTTNTIAVDGQVINGAATLTVTLPAPAANAVVAIFNSAASGVVTVSTPSGKIYGYGLGAAGASSFGLGTQGAAAVLQSDGVNWITTSGQQDSGWVPLTLASGITSNGFYVPSARLRGDTVQLKGGVQNPTGSPIANPFTVSAGLRPSALVQIPNALSIQTSGQCTQTLGAGLAFTLDGLTYTLS